MDASNPFFQYNHPNTIPPKLFKIRFLIIIRGVRGPRAIRVGKCPAPKIRAASKMENHTPHRVGCPSSVFFILKVRYTSRLMKKSRIKTSSFMPP
jgi:hypothetical protein